MWLGAHVTCSMCIIIGASHCAITTMSLRRVTRVITMCIEAGADMSLRCFGCFRTENSMAEQLNAPPNDPSLGLCLDTYPSPPPEQQLKYERQENVGDEPGPTTPCKEAPLIIAAITCSQIVKTWNCSSVEMIMCAPEAARCRRPEACSPPPRLRWRC